MRGKEARKAETNTVKVNILHQMRLTLMKIHFAYFLFQLFKRKYYLIFHVAKKSGIQTFSKFKILLLNAF